MMLCNWSLDASWSGPVDVAQRSPVMVGGKRTWVDHREIDKDNDFAAVGGALTATGAQRTGRAGTGEAHLMDAQALVDFATVWLKEHVYS